ncbi:MAG: tRNA (cytidine(34)-2'-O)-methyltransferase [Pseudomonadota bacterium]
MEIALYQPEIPQNTAAIIRTAACFDACVHIIGPAAFDVSDRMVRRAGLDYLQRALLRRHVDWDAFRSAVTGRVVLFTTKADKGHTDFAFAPGDCLLFGRESSGVPARVHDESDARVRIPMAQNTRSLNLAVAVGIGLAEGLRSTGAFGRHDVGDLSQES